MKGAIRAENHFCMSAKALVCPPELGPAFARRTADEDGGFELQSQLLLDCGEDGRACGSGRVDGGIVGCPMKCEIIGANETCMVENDTARCMAKDVDQVADSAILSRQRMNVGHVKHAPRVLGRSLYVEVCAFFRNSQEKDRKLSSLVVGDEVESI